MIQNIFYEKYKEMEQCTYSFSRKSVIDLKNVTDMLSKRYEQFHLAQKGVNIDNYMDINIRVFCFKQQWCKRFFFQAVLFDSFERVRNAAAFCESIRYYIDKENFVQTFPAEYNEFLDDVLDLMYNAETQRKTCAYINFLEEEKAKHKDNRLPRKSHQSDSPTYDEYNHGVHKCS